MRCLRRTIAVLALAAVTGAAGASAASAATFYVNPRGKGAPCSGKGINACSTIKEAILQAEKSAPPNTVQVETEEEGVPQLYAESLSLTNPKDAGLTINGEEPGVIIQGVKAPVLTGHLTGAVTVSNLTLRGSKEEGVSLRSAVALKLISLTLANVTVQDEQPGGEDAIEAREGATLIMNGGKVEVEPPVKGHDVFANEGHVVINGAKILSGLQGESEGGGVYTQKSSLAMTNTIVALEAAPAAESPQGIVGEKDSSVTLQNVSIHQGTAAQGFIVSESPTTVAGLTVEMLSGPYAGPAILEEGEAPAPVTLSRVQVSGSWVGAGLIAQGETTLTDSRITQGPSSGRPALGYVGAGAGRGLLIQRSTLQAQPGAVYAVSAVNGNATIDSSEILGGRVGARLEAADGVAHSLTLSASTLDAGAAGIAADAPGTAGVEAIGKEKAGSSATATIQGSIVLEKQVASAGVGDSSAVGCSYSAAPAQTQAAGGGAGSIACAAGAGGNIEVNPLSAVLAEPIVGYQLVPGSLAVDRVPAGALPLLAGITASATDLAGNPRVVDGNGDCVAVQDMGALELQGHAACPIKKGLPTPPPAISGLGLSPRTFSAAPRGATVAGAKKRYGTKIAWQDTQAATATFSVLRPLSGRLKGHSCSKPGRANRKGRRCTYYAVVGSFSHADRAGSNSAHFSGRLRGRALAKGSYRLSVVPRDAAGTGTPVTAAFTVR